MFVTLNMANPFSKSSFPILESIGIITGITAKSIGLNIYSFPNLITNIDEIVVKSLGINKFSSR